MLVGVEKTWYRHKKVKVQVEAGNGWADAAERSARCKLRLTDKMVKTKPGQ